jgi:hypothetical protein
VGFAAELVAKAKLGRGREFTRGPNTSSGKEEKLRPKASLFFGRGREVVPEGWSLLRARQRSCTQRLVSASGEEEMAPEGWSLLRARRRSCA